MFENVRSRSSPIPPEGADLSLLEVGHLLVQKGIYYPKSVSYYSSLIWCVSGSFSIRGDNWIRTCEANKLATIEPEELFDIFVNEDNTEVYYIVLDGAESDRVLVEGGLWPGVFPFSEKPTDLIQNIITHFDDGRQHNRVASIAFSMVRLAAVDAGQLFKEPIIFSICCYIHKNWSSPSINVNEILEHFSMSRSKISKLFKAQKNCTILEYLMEIRARKSFFYLKKGNRSVQEVAEMCGFNNLYYFSKWFTQTHSITPKEVTANSICRCVPSQETVP